MTVRQKIARMLKEAPLTQREISQAFGIREKDAAGHLEHIRHSARAEGEVFAIDPCTCLSCGFIFKERKKFAKPGRCPVCRGERIEEAVYYIR